MDSSDSLLPMLWPSWTTFQECSSGSTRSRLCSWHCPSIRVESKGDGKTAVLICSLASLHIPSMTQLATPRSTFQSPLRSVGCAAQFPSQPGTGSCGWGRGRSSRPSQDLGRWRFTSSPARNPAKHNRAAAEFLRNKNGKETKSGPRTPRSSEKQAHLPLLMELSQRERFNLF